MATDDETAEEEDTRRKIALLQEKLRRRKLRKSLQQLPPVAVDQDDAAPSRKSPQELPVKGGKGSSNRKSLHELLVRDDKDSSGNRKSLAVIPSEDSKSCQEAQATAKADTPKPSRFSLQSNEIAGSGSNSRRQSSLPRTKDDSCSSRKSLQQLVAKDEDDEDDFVPSSQSLNRNKNVSRFDRKSGSFPRSEKAGSASSSSSLGSLSYSQRQLTPAAASTSKGESPVGSQTAAALQSHKRSVQNNLDLIPNSPDVAATKSAKKKRRRSSSSGSKNARRKKGKLDDDSNSPQQPDPSAQKEWAVSSDCDIQPTCGGNNAHLDIIQNSQTSCADETALASSGKKVKPGRRRKNVGKQSAREKSNLSTNNSKTKRQSQQILNAKKTEERNAGLFPVLNLAQIWDMKEVPFKLPKEYTSLKLEFQRAQDVMSQSFQSLTPKMAPKETLKMTPKVDEDDQREEEDELEWPCSPSLLRTTKSARRRRKGGAASVGGVASATSTPLLPPTLSHNRRHRLMRQRPPEAKRKLDSTEDDQGSLDMILSASPNPSRQLLQSESGSQDTHKEQAKIVSPHSHQSASKSPHKTNPDNEDANTVNSHCVQPNSPRSHSHQPMPVSHVDHQVKSQSPHNHLATSHSPHKHPLNKQPVTLAGSPVTEQSISLSPHNRQNTTVSPHNHHAKTVSPHNHSAISPRDRQTKSSHLHKLQVKVLSPHQQVKMVHKESSDVDSLKSVAELLEESELVDSFGSDKACLMALEQEQRLIERQDKTEQQEREKWLQQEQDRKEQQEHYSVECKEQSESSLISGTENQHPLLSSNGTLGSDKMCLMAAEEQEEVGPNQIFSHQSAPPSFIDNRESAPCDQLPVDRLRNLDQLSSSHKRQNNQLSVELQPKSDQLTGDPQPNDDQLLTGDPQPKSDQQPRQHEEEHLGFFGSDTECLMAAEHLSSQTRKQEQEQEHEHEHEEEQHKEPTFVVEKIFQCHDDGERCKIVPIVAGGGGGGQNGIFLVFSRQSVSVYDEENRALMTKFDLKNELQSLDRCCASVVSGSSNPGHPKVGILIGRVEDSHVDGYKSKIVLESFIVRQSTHNPSSVSCSTQTNVITLVHSAQSISNLILSTAGMDSSHRDCVLVSFYEAEKKRSKMLRLHVSWTAKEEDDSHSSERWEKLTNIQPKVKCVTSLTLPTQIVSIQPLQSAKNGASQSEEGALMWVLFAADGSIFLLTSLSRQMGTHRVFKVSQSNLPTPSVACVAHRNGLALVSSEADEKVTLRVYEFGENQFRHKVVPFVELSTCQPIVHKGGDSAKANPTLPANKDHIGFLQIGSDLLKLAIPSPMP